MKKALMIIVAILILSVCLLPLAACNNTQSGEDVEITVLVPDGAPALSLAKLIKEQPDFATEFQALIGDSGNYKVNYQVVTGGATEVSAKMVSGEGDMAIIPTNLAAVLNNKIGAKIVTTDVQGLLYLVGKTEATSLNDLKGKVVYNIGQGATPDLTFKYILERAGIAYQESDVADASGEKVSLTYVSSGAELIPLLKQGKAEFGILGEPAVTKAVAATGATVKFDIQALWQEATGATTYGFPQASLIISKQLQDEKYADFISSFVDKIDENNVWLIDNASEAGAALASAGSLVISDTLTSAIVTRCNIKQISAADAKASVDTYLGVLYNFKAASVGGALPTDLYYNAK